MVFLGLIQPDVGPAHGLSSRSGPVLTTLIRRQSKQKRQINREKEKIQRKENELNVIQNWFKGIDLPS